MSSLACTAAAGLLIALAAPTLANADQLAISFNGTATVGEPLSVVAHGTAGGAHRLFVYADQSGYQCAATPHNEYSYRAEVLALSSQAGDTVDAGSFSETFSYTPTTDLFEICAYLDEAPSGEPLATATDSPVQDPVNKYLEDETEAPPVSQSTSTLPGAIEPLPVNPQIEREYWERVAREATSRAESERARSLTQKLAHPNAVLHCVVPSLIGHSLRGSRRALTRGHCRLGRVHSARAAHGTLLVTRQTPAPGRRLPEGAAVGVTLGARQAH